MKFLISRLKDGNELGNGTDGQLVLSNVQERDGGLYVCSVETDAGVSRSDEAEVIVDGQLLCIILLTLYQTAPPGWLSGERVGLMTWWLRVRSPVEVTFLSGVLFAKNRCFS